MSRATITKRSREVEDLLRQHISDEGALCVIKAPPGSGKTHTLLLAARHAIAQGLRVAVATQTNAQADDVCERLVEEAPEVDVWRFAASSAGTPDELPAGLQWTTDKHALPEEPCVVVATTAKWSLVRDIVPYDLLFVDEAWQMAWADFMLLGRVSGRFVLIGDPGQIPPVVSVPVERWETSPCAPHAAAPDILLADPTLDTLGLDLPACRRLPADAVDLIRPFYDFTFDAWARPGDRWLKLKNAKGGDAIDGALDLLADTSVSIFTLPTPEEGPPLECDVEVAAAAAELAVRALERGGRACTSDDHPAAKLRPADIGIAATHRVVNGAVLEALPPGLRDQTEGIRVDTPERWQGLQRPFMIVVHPLSGVVQPSAFDLETGRLCVMASRHQAAMVVVSRDHVPATLDRHIPRAEQAVGRPDVTGRGHAQHTDFWAHVARAGAVVAG